MCNSYAYSLLPPDPLEWGSNSLVLLCLLAFSKNLEVYWYLLYLVYQQIFLERKEERGEEGVDGEKIRNHNNRFTSCEYHHGRKCLYYLLKFKSTLNKRIDF